MIPNNLAVATVDNRLDSIATHEMRIDPTATRHLMSLLTNMYSDEEMACLREYSTNAHDSHLDAGQKRPIEVTTPTTLSPYLRIKDYGVGMNAETIRDVYSQYGKSTKRTQTDTNGSMGIGCKSALAYTNSFAVIGIKDSIKTHVSVSRNDQGDGIMEIVDESLTDEPNGVEIVIPAKRNSNFLSKAQSLFKFWPVGAVLLNGKAPESKLTKISDRLYTIDDASSYSGDVIVMGNVAYPVEGGLSNGYDTYRMGRSKPLAAFVTMNGADEVSFTPSREALMYTVHTKAVVQGLRKELHDTIVKMVQDTFDNAPSYGEAYKSFTEFEKVYAANILANVKYKGHSMPSGYIKDSANVVSRATVWRPTRSRHSVETNQSLYYQTIMEALIVKNYPGVSGVSGVHKAKIRAYAQENDISFGNSRSVVLLNHASVPGFPWTTNAMTVDWSEIKKIKLFSQSSGGSNYAAKSYAGGYDVYDPATGYYSLDHTLMPTDEIVYYSKSNKAFGSHLSKTAHDNILRYMPNVKFVEASVNRHDKLIKLFPKAMTPYAAERKVGALVVAALTTDDKAQLMIHTVRGLDYLTGIDYNDVDDTFLSEALRIYRLPKSQNVMAFNQIAEHSRRAVLEGLKVPELTDITTRYPLLDWRVRGFKDEILLYINAKYATLPKGD